MYYYILICHYMYYSCAGQSCAGQFFLFNGKHDFRMVYLFWFQCLLRVAICLFQSHNLSFLLHFLSLLNTSQPINTMLFTVHHTLRFLAHQQGWVDTANQETTRATGKSKTQKHFSIVSILVSRSTGIQNIFQTFMLIIHNPLHVRDAKQQRHIAWILL